MVNQEAIIRQKLLREFRSHQKQKRKTPKTVDVIVILSSGVEYRDKRMIIATKELFDRLRDGYAQAVVLRKTYTQNRHKVQTCPLIVLSGTEEQLPYMKQYISDRHWPPEATFSIACGRIGNSNTKVQFQSLRHPRILQAHRVLFVTSWYHVSRVKRTANKILPRQLHRSFWGTSSQPRGSTPSELIKKETDKIIAYIVKGDIAAS